MGSAHALDFVLDEKCRMVFKVDWLEPPFDSRREHATDVLVVAQLRIRTVLARVSTLPDVPPVLDNLAAVDPRFVVADYLSLALVKFQHPFAPAPFRKGDLSLP